MSLTVGTPENLIDDGKEVGQTCMISGFATEDEAIAYRDNFISNQGSADITPAQEVTEISCLNIGTMPATYPLIYFLLLTWRWRFPIIH